MGVGGSRTVGAFHKHLVVIEGPGMCPPGKGRKNRISPLLSGSCCFFFLNFSLGECPQSHQSLGAQSLNAAVKSCEVGWISPLPTPPHTPGIQPHPPPRNKVVMKSHRASFAQHSKSGKYQELFNRLLPTPNQFLFLMLSNIIAPSCPA